MTQSLLPVLIFAQEQKQLPSQYLRFSLSILTMNAESLYEHTDNILQSNPLLEYDYSDLRHTTHTFSPEYAVEELHGDLLDELRLQLHTAEAPQYCIENAERLMEHMDDNGYLRGRAVEEALPGCTPEEREEALKLLQSCEPLGIGARSLQECLLLQLQSSGEITRCARELISKHLEQLAESVPAMPEYAPSTVDKAVDLIQSLHPKPGMIFNSEPSRYLMPDVLLTQESGIWNLSLVNQPYTLRISEDYITALGKMDKETAAYIRAKKKEARELIESTSARKASILQVAQGILEHQQGFFARGEALLPLSYRKLGKALSLAPSTICRAVQSKALQFNGKCYALSFFFQTQSRNGSSSYAIETAIKHCIAAENPACPYSDSCIASLLVKEDIHASRRTVTKYRTRLGIPSSRARQSLL